MKFQITMKDPDGFYDCVRDAVKESLPAGLDDDEKETLLETRMDRVKTHLMKWFEYSEYLTVEVDTDAMTCVVVERK